MSDLAQELAIMERSRIYETLEMARRSICCYNRDPCDCKYGRTAGVRSGGEQTGCCELRDLITQLTGWTPFNRGQSIAEDIAARVGVSSNPPTDKDTK